MSFRQFSTTLKRVAGGTLDHGRYVNGAETTIPIVCGIQEPKPKELDLLPEGKRTKKALVVFSTTEFLLTTNEGRNADQVLIDGDYYEAQTSKKYRTMFPGNYRALCTIVDNPDDIPTP